MISIVIAMRSLWACKILNGDKKIEVRKGLALYNALKKAEERGEEVEFLMYVTKAKPYLDYIKDSCSGEDYQLDYDKLIRKPNMDDDDRSYNNMALMARKGRKDGSIYNEVYYNLNGKVVAKFKAKAEIIKENHNVPEAYYNGEREFTIYDTYDMDGDELLKESCLSDEQMFSYLHDDKVTHTKGTAIHIRDLEIFDKPKELSEFFHGFKLKNNGAITFDRDSKALRQRTPYGYEYVYPLSHAPRSWCYVQEA